MMSYDVEGQLSGINHLRICYDKISFHNILPNQYFITLSNHCSKTEIKNENCELNIFKNFLGQALFLSSGFTINKRCIFASNQKLYQ